jgi:WD40 repeat protein
MASLAVAGRFSVLMEGENCVWRVRVDPDGMRAAWVCAEGGGTGCAALSGGSDAPETIRREAGGELCVCWSQDGARVIFGTYGGALCWNEALSRTPPRTMVVGGGGVFSVDCGGPEGAFVLAGCADGGIRVISLDGEGRVVRDLAPASAAAAPVWGVSWSPDGARFASADGEGRVKVWSVATWSAVRDLLADPLQAWRSKCSSVQRLPSTEAAVWMYGGEPDAVSFRVSQTGVHVVGVSVFGGAAGTYRAELVLSCGAELVGGREVGRAQVTWESGDSRTVDVFFDAPLPVEPGTVYTIAVATSTALHSHFGTGGVASTRGEDGTEFEWLTVGDGTTTNGTDVLGGQIPRLLYVVSRESLSEARSVEELFRTSGGVRWSPDGARVAAAYDGVHKVCVFDASSGALERTLEGEGMRGPLDVDWSPDGRFVVAGGEDAALHVWDVRGGGKVLVLEGHTGKVCSVRWAATGDVIVSGSADGSVRSWDVAGRFPRQHQAVAERVALDDALARLSAATAREHVLEAALATERQRLQVMCDLERTWRARCSVATLRLRDADAKLLTASHDLAELHAIVKDQASRIAALERQLRIGIGEEGTG